jgi:hypothetical protein
MTDFVSQRMSLSEELCEDEDGWTSLSRRVEMNTLSTTFNHEFFFAQILCASLLFPSRFQIA